MNTQTETKTDDFDYSSETKQIASALSRVGAAWARYGLNVARASVATSAKTLELTATALGALAEGVSKIGIPEKSDDDVVDTTAESRS